MLLVSFTSKSFHISTISDLHLKTGTRIIVHSSIYYTFAQALLQKSASIERRIGDPKNPASMMGPIISQKQLNIIEELVQSAKNEGATILCGGNRMKGNSTLDFFDLEKGYFYPPTIIVGNERVKITDTRVWKEEIFGPVITLCSFDTEDEAINLANDSRYGLGAGIWTRDGSQAIRVADSLDCGIVWINTFVFFTVLLPFIY